MTPTEQVNEVARAMRTRPLTKILRASDVHNLVVQVAFILQHGDEIKAADAQYKADLAKYKADLAKYKRRAKDKKEVTRPMTVEERAALPLKFGRDPSEEQVTGFWSRHFGQKVFVPRPPEPAPVEKRVNGPRWLYYYSGYSREHFLGERVSHAEQHGLLPDSKYNRDIRDPRVEEYATAMQRGEWRDLLSDPITLTPDGQVVNGQHRLAAIERVMRRNEGAGFKWPEGLYDPQFLVIFGVHPKEAIYADGSRRTAIDEATIARKVAA